MENPNVASFLHDETFFFIKNAQLKTPKYKFLTCKLAYFSDSS